VEDGRRGGGREGEVLQSLRWLREDEIERSAVRAQYAAGSISGKRVPAYRDEPDVSPNSFTPTYAAVQFSVDNWRWTGVPFFVRSGKRMARRVSEIAVQFRQPPVLMFGHETRQQMTP